MLDLLLTVWLPLLSWGLFWAVLCGLLGIVKWTTAPRALAWAALACAGHACLPLLTAPELWATLLDQAPAPRSVPALDHTVDWASKVANVLWSGLLVYGLRASTPIQAGWQWPAPGSGRVVGRVLLPVALLVLLDAYLTRHAFRALWLREQLFVATLPALSEELFYRGALLGILSQAFARTLPLPGTRTSWGGLLGVLLFTLSHGLAFPYWLASFFYHWGHGTFEHQLPLGPELLRWLAPQHFGLARVGFLLAMGMLLLWVRERTGSCWAAVATHSLLNACLAWGHALP